MKKVGIVKDYFEENGQTFVKTKLTDRKEIVEEIVLPQAEYDLLKVLSHFQNCGALYNDSVDELLRLIEAYAKEKMSLNEISWDFQKYFG